MGYDFAKMRAKRRCGEVPGCYSENYNFIVELQTLIDDGEQNKVDLLFFLRNVRKYTVPKELTAEILNDLVEKIMIHAPEKSSSHRKQKIKIYYKAVGIINIADEDCVALDGRLGMQNRKKKTA